MKEHLSQPAAALGREASFGRSHLRTIVVLLLALIASVSVFLALRDAFSATSASDLRDPQGTAFANHSPADGISSARVRDLEAIVEAQSRRIESLEAAVDEMRRTPVNSDSANSNPTMVAFVERDEAGRLRSRGWVEAGLRVGHWEFWHHNGERSAEGEFIDGRKSGLWRTWNEQGALTSSGRYADGLRDGVWTFMSPDGTMEDIEYHNGEGVRAQ